MNERLAAALLCLFGTACAAPAPTNERTLVATEAPSLPQFRDGLVSTFLEARCGSLDCHGRPERPLRIHGFAGLRRPNDAGITTASAPTTDREIADNYASVVGLEPELIRAVAEGRSSSRELLLVAKPLACNPVESRGCIEGALGVEHQGGPIIAQGDDGYACLVSWLGGAVDADRCRAAARRSGPSSSSDASSDASDVGL